MKPLLLFMTVAALLMPQPAAAENLDKDEAARLIQEMYQARADALIQNHSQAIRPYYNLEEKTSRYALQHEIERSEYIRTWADKRKVVFVKAKSQVRIMSYKAYRDFVKMSVAQSLQLTYTYPDGSMVSQDFGIGTRHVLTLKKQNNQWFIYKEWYLDPLEEDPKLIPVWARMKDQWRRLPSSFASRTFGQEAKTGSTYNREKAVGYADKYAGLAWGAGNGNKYNPRYRDYTGQGGDCTNFSSQMLGDPEEGGGLRMTPSWYYRKSGSEAWVRTDSFKNFILRRGYGRLVIRGKYEMVAKANSRFPAGPFSQMKPGDLIGYELKGGDVDHFSILVGFDPKGYPLVNSHTADRYHVPWDLGWDQTTVFWLIHLKD